MSLKPSRFWELTPVEADPYYVPDAQEIAEMAEIERQQEACKHTHYNEEDGCLDCGFNSK